MSARPTATQFKAVSRAPLKEDAEQQQQRPSSINKATPAASAERAVRPATAAGVKKEPASAASPKFTAAASAVSTNQSPLTGVGRNVQNGESSAVVVRRKTPPPHGSPTALSVPSASTDKQLSVPKGQATIIKSPPPANKAATLRTANERSSRQVQIREDAPPPPPNLPTSGTVRRVLHRKAPAASGTASHSLTSSSVRVPLGKKECEKGEKPGNATNVPHGYDNGSVGYAGVGLLCERFLIVTGGLRKDETVPLSTIACYDTLRNVWIPNELHTSGVQGGSGCRSVMHSLPNPLYGHCCVTHGQRSVWLVGGLSLLCAAKSIVRLTLEINWSDDDGAQRIAKSFSIVGSRTFGLQFPVIFASVLKLQGALNPVALFIGGLSSVRDTECGDATTLASSNVESDAHNGNGDDDKPAPAATPLMPLSTTTNHGTVITSVSFESLADCDVRRLGLTNRIFALNLDDCSIYRVGQSGEAPSPRMLSAAAPILRRDASGSHNGIIYYGGVTADFVNGRGGSSSTAATDVYTASVNFDNRFCTYSVAWTRHKRRSAAEPWPSPVAGHTLVAAYGFALLLGGTPLTSTEKHDDVAYVLLFDVSTGVAWSTGNYSRFLCSEAQCASGVPTSTPYDALKNLVYHRSVEMANPEELAPASASTTSCLPPSASTLFIVGGGVASTPLIQSFRIVDAVFTDTPVNRRSASTILDAMDAPTKGASSDSTTIVAAADSGGDTTLTMLVDFQISNESRLKVDAKWETVANRAQLTIDELATMCASHIFDAPNLADAIPPVVKQKGQIEAKRIVEHNLQLHGRGISGERVPLTSDHVLTRMISRAGRDVLHVFVTFTPPLTRGQCLQIGQLGRGAFGVVTAAICNYNGLFVAVKEVQCSSEENIEILLREIRLMRSLDHPNIVKYLGIEVASRRQSAFIFMEYVTTAECKSLAELIKKFPKAKLPVPLMRTYLRQVLDALDYLHSYNIVHQDIKAANVLVSGSEVKLADFGTARQLVEFSTDDQPSDATIDGNVNRRVTRDGTAAFMAPEAMCGNSDMTTASDIWSLGCLLIEMATGELPWLSQLEGDRRDAFFKLQAKLARQEIPSFPQRRDFPAAGVNFLRDCLVHDPKLRKTARQLKDHPFITESIDELMSVCEPSPPSIPGSGFPSFQPSWGRQQSEDFLVASQNYGGAAGTLENIVESFVPSTPMIPVSDEPTKMLTPAQQGAAAAPQACVKKKGPPIQKRTK